MKKKMYLLSKIASCFMAFAGYAIVARSLFWTYQPEIPEKLKKH